RICILLRATMCLQGLQRDNKSGCEWKEFNDFLRFSKKSGSTQLPCFAYFFTGEKVGRSPQRAKHSCSAVDET
ncbi:MAG: hypothetical protein ACI4KH_06600, partial [Oscillospiraceae bacterium]